MVDINLPLPCIACGFQPTQAFPGHSEETAMVPYAATIFTAGNGHYGSTVWDKMTSARSLWVNICDACLVKRKDRVAMVATTTDVKNNFHPWEPGDGD